LWSQCKKGTKRKEKRRNKIKQTKIKETNNQTKKRICSSSKLTDFQNMLTLIAIILFSGIQYTGTFRCRRNQASNKDSQLKQELEVEKLTLKSVAKRLPYSLAVRPQCVNENAAKTRAQSCMHSLFMEIVSKFKVGSKRSCGHYEG